MFVFKSFFEKKIILCSYDLPVKIDRYVSWLLILYLHLVALHTPTLVKAAVYSRRSFTPRLWRLAAAALLTFLLQRDKLKGKKCSCLFNKLTLSTMQT